jgi:hypothetical protein
VLIAKGKKISDYLNEAEWNFKPNAVLEGEGGPGILVDATYFFSKANEAELMQ